MRLRGDPSPRGPNSGSRVIPHPFERLGANGRSASRNACSAARFVCDGAEGSHNSLSFPRPTPVGAGGVLSNCGLRERRALPIIPLARYGLLVRDAAVRPIIAASAQSSGECEPPGEPRTAQSRAASWSTLERLSTARASLPGASTRLIMPGSRVRVPPLLWQSIPENGGFFGFFIRRHPELGSTMGSTGAAFPRQFCSAGFDAAVASASSYRGHPALVVNGRDHRSRDEPRSGNGAELPRGRLPERPVLGAGAVRGGIVPVGPHRLARDDIQAIEEGLHPQYPARMLQEVHATLVTLSTTLRMAPG